ncbi:hypothetical protein BT96DRAFT_69578 [Gymnopus androsaceus JB14]|uniref:Uncharacterized protein n=1 Tax=Gymnopus androsaceus JB14 TaxID=1447944 RepID=A0A6A4GD94_9AGAR|nr:hypothetical protein BT96DRAFT_69578 [Gymnopus androsaceus JB14]
MLLCNFTLGPAFPCLLSAHNPYCRGPRCQGKPHLSLLKQLSTMTRIHTSLHPHFTMYSNPPVVRNTNDADILGIRL